MSALAAPRATGALAALALAACRTYPAVTAPPLPPPPGAEWLQTDDGLALYTRVEPPLRGPPRGVVWLVLGPEVPSAPLYPRLGAALREAGFAVAVLHPRGTGYSPGLRGHVEDYGRFLGDYRAYAAALGRRFSPAPLFLLARAPAVAEARQR